MNTTLAPATAPKLADSRQGEEVTRLIRSGYRMVGATRSVLDDPEIVLEHYTDGRFTVYFDGSVGPTVPGNRYFDPAKDARPRRGRGA